MKKAWILSVAIALSLAVNAKVFNIKDLGADTHGKKLCTKLIGQAITDAAKEGGGTLYFPAGTYLTGPIHMQSNTTLHLEAGATLKFSDDFEQYLPFIKVRYEGVFMNTFSPLIYADGCQNVNIIGEGTIDGQGEKWWAEAMRISAIIRKNGDVAELTKLQKKWVAENKGTDFQVGDYFDRTLKTRFFRPPFIQFQECQKIKIEGITIKNSPFWTINPVGCNNVVIHGITIFNPNDDPHGPNTDGINPSSCSNVRISDCFISVGDDCVTIKSGRDKAGRVYGRPCENITVTNCVMLTGHGGVVIGSEMSGSVKNVTISNCVFDGTDTGIRIKASRGRGGVVERIRVDNIVMRNIQRNAFTFNLFYDKKSKPEPVSERTPIFRDIHISNVTGTGVKAVGFIRGIEEMPVSQLSFNNINIAAKTGFIAHTATDLHFTNIDLAVTEGPCFAFENCDGVVLNDVRSSAPLKDQAIVEVVTTQNMLLNNCFQKVKTDVFLNKDDSPVIWSANNFMHNVTKKELP